MGIAMCMVNSFTFIALSFSILLLHPNVRKHVDTWSKEPDVKISPQIDAKNGNDSNKSGTASNKSKVTPEAPKTPEQDPNKPAFDQSELEALRAWDKKS